MVTRFKEEYTKYKKLFDVFADKAVKILGLTIVVAIVFGIFFNLASLNSSKSAKSARQETTNISSSVHILKEKIVNIDSYSDKEKREIYFQAHMVCSLRGQLCHPDPEKVNKDDFENSIVFRASSFLAYPFINMPASGVGYTQQSIAQAGLIPSTLAYDGFGAEILSPFQNAWIQVRNVAYAIIVLIIILESFALMFRTKVASEGALAIESYVPRIIGVLIFIQFSYAIAGFLIDAMFILTTIIYLVLQPLFVDVLDIEFQELVSNYFFGGPYDLFTVLRDSLTGFTGGRSWLAIFWDIPINLITIFGPFVAAVIMAFIDGFVALQVFETLGGPATLGLLTALGGLVSLTGPFAPLVAALGGGGALIATPWLFIVIIMFIILLVFSWRTLMILIRAYFTLIMMVIFAPIYLLMSLVPGNQLGIQSWLKGLISELIVFPALMTMFFSLLIFQNVARNAVQVGSPVHYPFVPNESGGILFVVGLIAVTLFPKFIAMIRSLIVKSVFKDLEDEARGNVQTVRGTVSGGLQRIGRVGRGIHKARNRPTP